MPVTAPAKAVSLFERIAQVEPGEAASLVRALAGDAPLDASASRFRSTLEPELWRRAHEAGTGADPAHLLVAVDLVRALLSTDPYVRQRIRAFARSWPPVGRARLLGELRELSVSEGALYLSSYKPRGRIVTPPFGLMAECLLQAHGREPARDDSLFSSVVGAAR